MKILVLANSDIGLYRFRKELLHSLLQQHSVTIALPNGPFLPQLADLGCNIIKTTIDRRGTNPLKDIHLFFRYVKIIHSEKPDIVISYTIKPNVYGGLACRITKTQQLANITGLGTSIENKGFLQIFTLFLYRTGLKQASCVFFQNTHNLTFMQKHRVVQKNFRLLPGSGVNLDENAFEPYPTNDGSIRFLFVGRIMKDKGIEELLVCTKEIICKYPHVSFDIAGEFDEPVYRSQLEALHKQGYVTYLGFCNDVHCLMKTHHAVILPSYHEGLSNVLLEAAACGRPVITTNVPGCRETFDDGISGFGSEARNATSLRDAIIRFIELPYDQKIAMGMRGREKMVREFDRRLIIDAYHEEINNLDTPHRTF